MSSEIAAKLNPEQKKSVIHGDGPLLIIAGAGTGKTTVITHRIAHLIVDEKIKPSEILALTFTDKAAYQMQEKVDILVPYGFTDTWISTFHSFGDRVLRENALEIGLDPDFKVLTRPQAAVFFQENLFKFQLKHFRPLGNPIKFVDAMISLFSRALDEDVSPQEYLVYAEDLKKKSAENPKDDALAQESERQMELAVCYRQYQDLLLKEGKLDFANQFYLSLKLLREHPRVLKRYQNQFRYVLVDEFQDTNYAQFELVKLLSGGHRNLTVVADDDQSIYKWRGAAVSNIMNFVKMYPDSEKIALTQNYRSTQIILDASYRLIQNNNPDRFEVQAKIDKRLIAQDKAGQIPKHMHFDTLSSEADWVSEYIEECLKKKKYEYKDFAILVRSNATADPFIRALNMRGIPWQFSGNQGLYSLKEVRLCIHFLRVIANPADSLSLFYLATSNIYQIPTVELTQVMHCAKRRLWDLFFTLKRIDQIEELSELSDEFIEKKDQFLKDVERYIDWAKDYATGRLLYTFLTETGFIAGLVKEQNIENEDTLKNIAKFFDIVKNFEHVTNEDRVLYFIQYLDMMINVGDDPAVAEADMDTPAVNVMTLHKAKGLEFPVVFMVSLIEKKFPWPRRSDPIELPCELIKDILPLGDFHIQEERRLFYVGMTRAEKELFLTSAIDYGTKQPRKVSRFVVESVEEKKDVQTIKASALQAIERNAPNATPPVLKKSVIACEEILKLSYYQIDDYLTCPLKYKYIHILRVPIMTHHTVAYGKALHDAVQLYHQRKMDGRSVTLDDVVEAFENSLKKHGFLSKEHIDLRVQSGNQALKNFFLEQERLKIIPLFVEKEFSFMIENNRIVGRWDRVDVLDGVATVIDFKSSEVKTQVDADKKAKANLQLNLYSLAYEKMTGTFPDFKELHFLETGLIGRAQVTQKDIEKILTAVEDASDGIRKGIFEPKPNYLACSYCAYNQICPKSSEGKR
ncbi:MAG: UvrD-helicase domain-containing protein [Candidatus Aceula lacicola]|nr:UvrD-helicase domain-containing protein [Candidatus Aceula lacicola]